MDYTVSDDRLWYDKYSLRKPMLPSFIPLDMATKILNIGKSINFIRYVCKDRSFIIRDEDKALERTKAEKNAGALLIILGALHYLNGPVVEPCCFDHKSLTPFMQEPLRYWQ